MTDTSSIKITSHAIEPVVDLGAYEELLEALSEGLESRVERKVYDHEPPAAGMSEIAAIISFLADSKEVILPVITWMAGQFGGPAFRKMRDHLDRSRRSKQSGRPYIPLCVVFGRNPENLGSVRFYFHGRPTESQLKSQFDEMYRVIDALPEQALAEDAGPPEYGYFWDEEHSRWRGQLFYSANPDSYGLWFPDDLFDRVPGWSTSTGVDGNDNG